MEGEERSQMELMPVEIERIVKAAVKLGINKIKFTGGEPLIRNDLPEIIYRVANVNGIKDVALTTNGSILKNVAKKLWMSGLKRMNVNLPSIREDTYIKITNSKYTPKQIIEGIIEAKKYGINPIKVNMVVLNGVNNDQIWELIQFTKQNDLILQLIELENVGIDEDFYRNHHFDLTIVEEEIERMAEKIIIRTNMQNRRRYILKGGGEVEIVKPYEDGSFCSACTRIRLTVNGKLKPCLMRNDNLIDIITPMRKGASDEEVMKYIMMAIEVREPYWKKRSMP